jgi:hypothetical protein
MGALASFPRGGRSVRFEKNPGLGRNYLQLTLYNPTQMEVCQTLQQLSQYFCHKPILKGLILISTMMMTAINVIVIVEVIAHHHRHHHSDLLLLLDSPLSNIVVDC